MTSDSADLVSRLLKQSIITLCRETVTFRSRLEVDGIVCLAVDGAEQHVVKIHEIFGAKGSPVPVIKEEPRLPTPEITRVPSPNVSNGSAPETMDMTEVRKTNGRLENKKEVKSNSSQLFDNLPFRSTHIPSVAIKEESADDNVADEKNAASSPAVLEKYRSLGLEKLTLSNAKYIPCKKCGKTIENVAQYESHNMTAHGHFTCMICLSTFTSRNNMKRHIRLHTGVRPYVCHKCPESFSRNDDFKRHLLRHTYQKPFRCTTCQAGFSDRGSVRAHMIKEHNCSVFHACPQCGECYDDMKKLLEHKKTHTDFLDYRCSLCAFTGSNALMYNKHMLTHGPPKQYTCRHCETSFPDPFTYTNHLKKHKGDELVQSYACCFCDLTLTTFEQFQRHEHSHVHSKQHTCSVCQKHFRYPSNLREHMLTHIPKSDLMDAAKNHGSDAQKDATEETSKDAVAENNQYEREMAEASDDMEENNNIVQKNEQQYDIGSDYWCTECHHGFGTEHDLQNHIMSQHEQNGQDNPVSTPVSPKHDIPGEEDPDVQLEESGYTCSTQMAPDINPYEQATQIDPVIPRTSRPRMIQNYCDEATKVNKRKSATRGTRFIATKRNRMYNKEIAVEDVTLPITSTEPTMIIPVTAIAEIETEIKHRALKTQLRNLPVNRKEIKSVSTNGLNSSGDSSISDQSLVLLLPVMDGSDRKCKMDTLGITSSMTPTKIHRQSPSASPYDDDAANSVTSFKNKRTTLPVSPVAESNGTPRANDVSDDNNDSSEISHYSKTSVLGMDTEFSASPNCSSPTTINLKVRNPGFEKVITPDILFETKAPFTCEICKETFEDFVTFDQHGVKIHRRFICSYCGKAFTSRPNRERHVRYHTGEKPYKCDLCPVSFFRGDDLKYHRTTKHADVKPFTCGACQASFSYPKDLEKHLRVHPDHKL